MRELGKPTWLDQVPDKAGFLGQVLSDRLPPCRGYVVQSIDGHQNLKQCVGAQLEALARLGVDWPLRPLDGKTLS